MRSFLTFLLLSTLWGADAVDDRFDNIWHMDLFLSGASWHPGHRKEFNQTNPGAGLGFNVQRRRHDDISLAVQGMAMTYLDSFREQANVIGVGPQMTLGQRSGWHGELTALIGRLEGSGASNQGIQVLPYVGVGYRQLTLQAFYVPKGDNTKGHPEGHPDKPLSSAVGVWLKWSIPLN